MLTKRVNAQQLIMRHDEINGRITEIAELCEKEQRSMTDAEKKEVNELVREKELVSMRMHTLSTDFVRENASYTSQEGLQIVRDNMAAGKQTKIVLYRDMVMVQDAVKGGIVPVKIMDIIKPLSEGLILDKVGLPLPTGLSGDYVWPVYEAIEATIQGEGVALSDTKIDMAKLTAAPQRVGVAMPVSRQTINQTDGIIELIVKDIIPLGVARLLNRVMFSCDKVTNATTLVGPFVGLKSSAVQLKNAEPTFRDFNDLKAKVLASGVDGEHLCFVMTKSQKAIAEGTPKDAGSGIMVCENDMIAGLPVFTTNFIGEGYIGLGDWRYQPLGLFGEFDFVIDPYSQARKNAVDFVFNANFGTTTLQPKAFALAKVKGGVA